MYSQSQDKENNNSEQEGYTPKLSNDYLSKSSSNNFRQEQSDEDERVYERIDNENNMSSMHSS